MSKLYVPKGKIVIASSFEGVFNDGARECAFISLNVHQKMLASRSLGGSSFFNKLLEPSEFRGPAVSDSKTVRAFLALRPLVKDAADYLTVLQILAENPKETGRLLETGNVGAVEFFTLKFNAKKAATTEERAAFTALFLPERKAWQASDYEAWLALQSPYTDTLAQLRQLAQLREFDSRGNQTRGFVLGYVTSKDEKTAFQLCNIYAELGYMGKGEVFKPAGDTNFADHLEGMKTCIVDRNFIIGKESVENDKVEQMRLIAKRAGVPNENVWRVNDRFDLDERRELARAGFPVYMIITGGYAFPDNYAQAKEHRIMVIENENFASTLSEYARINNF